MRSFALFTAVAACLASVSLAAGGIDPSQCMSTSSLSYSYALTTSCMTSSISHADGSSTTNKQVTITVDFPVNGPSGALSTSGPTSDYMIFVWDRSQGASSSGEPFSFGSAPTIVPITDNVNALTPSQFTAITLQQKSSSGFAQTSAVYLYALRIPSPAGRWTIQFQTMGSLGSTKTLNYNVAVMAMDPTQGHNVGQPGGATTYAFGSAGSTAYVPIEDNQGDITASFIVASGYAPASRGIMVQHATLGVTTAGGVKFTSSQFASWTTGSQTSDWIDQTGNSFFANFDLPPLVPPTDYKMSAGRLTISWIPSFIDLTQNGIGVDTTIFPGPFLTLTPGTAQDSYVDALVLAPGGTASVNFDGTAVAGATPTRAKASRQLIRLATPMDWWSIRLAVSALASSGNSNLNAPAQAPGFAGSIKYTTYTSPPSSRASFTTALPVDPHNNAAYFIPNTGLGLSAGNPNQPFSGVTNPQYISGSATNSNQESGRQPNYPVYDSRASTGTYMYIYLCRNSGCSLTPASQEPYSTTVTIQWSSTGTISGECSSNADCVSNQPEGHPSQQRASHFSANGDVNRFDTCVLLPSGSNPNYPESKCIECTSNCDCMPGQYCNILSGVMSYGSGLQTVDELTRLRSGICMKKDLNNTQLGQPCRQSPYTPATYSVVTGNPKVASLAAVPYMEGQSGPIQCGDVLFVNNSFPTAAAGKFFNVSALPYDYLWQGYCDGAGICRECARSVAAASNVVTQCGSGQVCLDGMYQPTVSVDQTIRTFANDTRAGTLLAIVFMLIFMLLGGIGVLVYNCWQQRRGAAHSPGSKTSNPLDSARASA